ncbi:MAG: hypothetical protein ABRQ39_25995 [Candidatus Eremiobacterota bacterium]
MFDDLLNTLKDLEKPKTISIPIIADENGYCDKECPSEECKFQFKVYAEDWKNLFKDEAVYCPFCRHKAISNSWWTTEQIENAKRQAIRYIEGKLSTALKRGAETFNRRQPKDSFISISLKVSGFRPEHYFVPITGKEAMELKIQCEKCNARYSVIGSAFFCPCCGYNSVERTFDDAIKKVEAKLDNLNLIRTALIKAGKKDDAELTCRSLIESGLTDCVVAFQRFLEEIYKKQNNVKQPPFNVFQRIEDGSKLWKDLLQEGYEDWLTQEEMNELKLLFQKRHLLAHCEGLVDQKYIDKSGDKAYQVGQRIVVKEKDVRTLAILVRKIVNKIKEKL